MRAAELRARVPAAPHAHRTSHRQRARLARRASRRRVPGILALLLLARRLSGDERLRGIGTVNRGRALEGNQICSAGHGTKI